MADLRIVGKAFIYGEVVEHATVEIEDGRISKISIGESGSGYRMELSGKEILLPSATDLHVHLRDWEQAYKEDVGSGTEAAIAGGVTTIAEMPNTRPPIDSASRLAERIELLRSRSLVDFAVHVGSLRNVDEARTSAELGACGMKLYPGDLPMLDEYIEACRLSGLRLVVHAEFKGGDEVDAVDYVLSRVRRGDRVRFAHVSREGSVKMISRAKEESGAEITAEAAPHHFLLSEETLDASVRDFSHVRPPLASVRDATSIYEGLKSCVIDFVASDHAPHTFEEKVSETPAPGFPGLEIMYPIMLTEHVAGRISLETVVKKLCKAPAEYLGVPKGDIRPGLYADLVVFELGVRERVDPSRFLSRAKYTVFAGWPLACRVSAVYRRGELVYEGEVKATGGGRHVAELR